MGRVLSKGGEGAARDHLVLDYVELKAIDGETCAGSSGLEAYYSFDDDNATDSTLCGVLRKKTPHSGSLRSRFRPAG
eukprot:SAG31_NODE_4500_length_3183_cov_29.068093_1_plen_77_part_00